jgi:hypothetical protein
MVELGANPVRTAFEDRVRVPVEVVPAERDVARQRVVDGGLAHPLHLERGESSSNLLAAVPDHHGHGVTDVKGA